MTVESATIVGDSSFQVTKLLLGNGDVFEIESNTTSARAVTFRIPGKLPPNTKVTIEAQLRILTSSATGLRISSYTDDLYGGSDGTGSGYIDEGSISGSGSGIVDNIYDYVKNTITTRSTHPYVSCSLAYDSTVIPNRACQVRDVKVTIEGDGIGDRLHNITTLPQSTAQFYDYEEIANQCAQVISGTGTVTDGGTYFTVNADTASAAYIVKGLNSTDAATEVFKTPSLIGSDGIIVDVDVTRFSGLPVVKVDYFDSGGSFVDDLRSYITIDNGRQSFWFPAIEGAEHAEIHIGAFNFNACVADIRGYGYRVVNAKDFKNSSKAYQPVATSLIRSGGTWQVDYGTYGTSSKKANGGVVSVSTTATAIVMTLEDSFRGFPTCVAQLSDFDYDCVVFPSGSNNKELVVNIFDRSTTLVVDPNSLSNGVSLNVVGGGFY